jgi:hypothetical protein
MFRASVVVLPLACALSWPETARAEEADKPVNAGGLVWTEQADKPFKAGDLVWTAHEGGSWTIHVRLKDTAKRVNHKVKAFTERGLTIVPEKQPNAGRYELLIPWHAISAIYRDTDEPVDEPK